MEIILNKTIDTLGLEGEIVNVKPGYARNYLIPKKFATLVNKANLARLEKEQQAIAKRLEEEKKGAESLAAQLEDKVLTITRKVGEDERLFGSVNTADIAEKLAELGVTVERRSILLSEPIKKIGESKVAVKVGYQMTTDVTVQVVPESAEEEKA
ncbi:MAG: 50S ribosomal protein L9 [Desulfobulbus sp.]|nr:MAG: 50S ribosomal protein L9 [Desulfobulbus sp.]RUM39763.1 MAG: 50S ribosomal protein L9 [Desulfobulbus sp.]